ncbi:MAG: protease inhibitor I42 family protein [Clostridia bacterium]|nr:protease inhibitor I42 family protein [Clostridia bacterium]
MKRIPEVIGALILAVILASPTGSTALGGSLPEGQDPGTAVLILSSFDGGGYAYTVSIEDKDILSCTTYRDYGDGSDNTETGSTYDEVFTFTGLKPGTTTVTITGRSPILENVNYVYTAAADTSLQIKLTPVKALSYLFLYRCGEIAYDSYLITRDEDRYFVSVNDGKKKPFDRSAAEALAEIINEYALAEWDGFSKSQPGIPDGESFWLEIRLTDGISVRADGDNAFPKDYFTVIGRMQDILDHAAGKE